MEMIGHYGKDIKDHAGVRDRHFLPKVGKHPTCGARNERALANLAEQSLTIMCAERDEIGVARAVVKALQALAFAV